MMVTNNLMAILASAAERKTSLLFASFFTLLHFATFERRLFARMCVSLNTRRSVSTPISAWEWDAIHFF